MKFNDKILQLRSEQKMSQEELSEASGISVRTIQRIEKDEVNPRPYTERKLLEAFNISLSEFNLDSHNTSNSQSEECTKLNRFLVLNLLVFLLPVLFLIPVSIVWKKGKWSDTSNLICKKILSFQIIWIIVTIAIILFTLSFISLSGGQNVVGKLLPTPVLVYLCLSLIDVLIVFKIARSFKYSLSGWTSIIPDLY